MRSFLVSRLSNVTTPTRQHADTRRGHRAQRILFLLVATAAISAQAQDAARSSGDSEYAVSANAATQAKELRAWQVRIQSRIRGKVVIPEGTPENARAEYAITVIPGGEVLSVRMVVGSGFPAYDESIERAIRAASPLPVPSDPRLFQQLRELRLVFRPSAPTADERALAGVPGDPAPETSPARPAARVSAPAVPGSEAELARRALQSTVSIAMQASGGTVAGVGSGFLVGPGLVVTNLHVVAGHARGFVKKPGLQTTAAILGVVAVDERADLAIVKVGPVEGEPLSVAPTDSASVGDRVYVVGSPRALEGTFTDGLISGFRSERGVRYLQISAPISKGSSGGPVLSRTGAVVGVVRGYLDDGQNLNFAVSAEHVAELLARVGDVRALASVAATNEQAQEAGAGRAAPTLSGERLTWTYHDEDWRAGHYSLSLVNGSDEDVRKVRGYVIFLTAEGEVIDTAVIEHEAWIPAGLARRVTGTVDASVQRLAARTAFRLVSVEPDD